MLNSQQQRELAYLVKIDSIEPIPGKDRVECARVGGWTIMVRKNQFKAGDLGIYFEIDSKVPEKEPFTFLASKHYKIKTQKYKTSDGQFWSQGLLMHPDDFGWETRVELIDGEIMRYVVDNNNKSHFIDIQNNDSRFLTAELGVTYAVDEDNIRKANPADKYKSMAQRKGKLFSYQPFRWLMKREWGRKLLFIFFGKKKDTKTNFPTRFPYIHKTDQERCENMKWVLNNKNPFIVTQKCDGSSATYILERKPLGRFEFYVCSRNVRLLNAKQETYYDKNYYWDCAIKYDIENKLKIFLKNNPDRNYVCWQGEICGPGIQNNPHGLSEIHLFLFHMIDSLIGKYDIRDARTIWEEFEMEYVPIVNENYILPDDFEEFKLSADGMYDPSCCEGKTAQRREGFVYYNTIDPNFSFKNVSRIYLEKH